MQIQSLNNNESFGAYYRGNLLNSHAKIVDSITTELNNIGENIHLCVASGKSWDSTARSVNPCVRITAYSKNAIYAPPYIGEVFLKSTNPAREILQMVKKLSNSLLKPLDKK